ncbi:MAG: 23S rRNA (uridine(2552)-2'-O)-methyltransferase RlmE [Gammaproteobacteria bacterium]|nr:23S rRNA (uridine(2552)-2'-O)-methyltransferase RlmE [Gammaproteobacteria bacterium]NNJ71759.1 23S rRNA (uridine(2552)-2'-O)-methyltransferase RlmE [Enterobacterales bacterium]
MSRSKSSNRWLNEHFKDPYVQQAQKDGFRSRAVYKLEELHEKDSLFRTGQRIIDLGAAPGGWSQWLSQVLQHNATLIATDILPMDALPDVTFIEGDFTEKSVLDEILAAIGDEGADLVISDMAPNMSGMDAIDQPKAMYLVELALDLSTQVLRENGAFVCKAFHGSGFEVWLAEVRKHFRQVKIRKPKASRPRSREVYLVAKGFRAD